MSDVYIAPDGSIIVADWYDRGVGGHGMGDPTDGRIYRITPNGHTGHKVPETKLDTKEGVLAAVGSPNQATRALAIAVLDARGPAQVWDQMADVVVGTASPTLKARAYWSGVRAGQKLANAVRTPRRELRRRM